MSALDGLRIMILLGPGGLVPAPEPVVQAVDRIEVTHEECVIGGMQISFRSQREGVADALDHPLVASPLFLPNARIVIVVLVGVVPQVLFDGVVTRRELKAGNGGAALFTVTALDLSALFRREERVAEYPEEPDALIVERIVAGYAEHGLIPEVIPPVLGGPPLPQEGAPTQAWTDHQHVTLLARRYGYVFHVTPGPAPGTSTAYWGPRVKPGLPQSAITIGMGPFSNARDVEFSYDGSDVTLVSGAVQDPALGEVVPVQTLTSEVEPLSLEPHVLVYATSLRTRLFRAAGVSPTEAMAQAQGMTDASVARVAEATGTLDTLAYGGLLQPHRMVGLRGAGAQHDGLWFVSRVTHEITRRSYTQRFTLTREGAGAITPEVVP